MQCSVACVTVLVIGSNRCCSSSTKICFIHGFLRYAAHECAKNKMGQELITYMGFCRTPLAVARVNSNFLSLDEIHSPSIRRGPTHSILPNLINSSKLHGSGPWPFPRSIMNFPGNSRKIHRVSLGLN